MDFKRIEILEVECLIMVQVMAEEHGPRKMFALSAEIQSCDYQLAY